ncbi:MAG TPA: PEP/pyruvate-binding domain-containing protein, partial [Actinoplanes sp.]|nr:PEP/pyruvate-binding domain-containing protein [Actinoplanes sp.]
MVGNVPTEKFVYDFAEGNKDLKDLLGGKGANLAEMTNLGLPVPAGFTITTRACQRYLAAGTRPDGLDDEIAEHLARLESAMGRRLGDPADPLLVSVRSGAKFSMPGMMETVLNVGLNDDSVAGLSAQAGGNDRFAWDSYRRLIQMFGKTVCDVPGHEFEDALQEAKMAKGVRDDVQLDADDLRRLVDAYKEVFAKHTGHEFPQDPREQLELAIEAVFRSWDADRAVLYRRQERIP